MHITLGTDAKETLIGTSTDISMQCAALLKCCFVTEKEGKSSSKVDGRSVCVYIYIYIHTQAFSLEYSSYVTSAHKTALAPGKINILTQGKEQLKQKAKIYTQPDLLVSDFLKSEA